jgi:hypothetical protein
MLNNTALNPKAVVQSCWNIEKKIKFASLFGISTLLWSGFYFFYTSSIYNLSYVWN